MKRVYIAGAYSASNIIDCLDNIRKGMRAATEIFLAGYAPFCPWHDHLFQFQLREGETLSVDNYYQYSLAWLEVSDTMLVIPGWENSKGTKKEIERAYQLGIPIFYSMQELIEKVIP